MHCGKKGRYKALSGCNGTGFVKLQLPDLNINGVFFRASRVMLGEQFPVLRVGFDSHWIKFLTLFQVVYTRILTTFLLQDLEIICGVALGAAPSLCFYPNPTLHAVPD